MWNKKTRCLTKSMKTFKQESRQLLSWYLSKTFISSWHVVATIIYAFWKTTQQILKEYLGLLSIVFSSCMLGFILTNFLIQNYTIHSGIFFKYTLNLILRHAILYQIEFRFNRKKLAKMKYNSNINIHT